MWGKFDDNDFKMYTYTNLTIKYDKKIRVKIA